ncbi:SDR family NAD(P)-dependent oxidoreductase [Spirosoma aerolatum]|uniref:SDR family NAD(P)-dependent oxidoreductase n=1 Tax=Spirosoma aerolatum TaxID=1211326 RepID=UPI0014767BDE|nr:3-oxoacyl-ACP reductase family protein [Spirosoma aerolatum]
MNNKVALVTGASRGIGKAIAIELAKNGANVVINYLEDDQAANEVVKIIKSFNVEAISVRADVGDPDQVEAMAKVIEEKFEYVDILVNNAGVIKRPGEWDLIAFSDIDETINTNLKGPIFCMRQFVPKMILNKFGRIINITSTYGITGAAGVLVYTAAKAGVVNITHSMARELGKYNITVNAIAPGNIDTRMTSSAGEDFKKWVENTSPIPRLGTPQEVAEAAMYLINSQYVSGHVLTVDGGHILNM